MIKIVLDSNVFVNRDWHVDQPNMFLLKSAVEKGLVEVIVPEIVSQEVKNHYKEKVTKEHADIVGKAKRLNGILKGDEILKIGEFDIDTIATNYNQSFDENLSALPANRPGYEAIPHGDLIARDLDRRRPFQDSGKGYRDSLLWETILREVADNELDTILVTNNKNDFCSGDDYSLHPNLVDDLERRGIPKDRVRVYKDLDSFIDQEVKPQLALAAQALQALNEKTEDAFSFEQWFDDNTETICSKLTDQIIEYGLPTLPYEMLESLYVTYIENPQSIEAVEIYELDNDREYIEYSFIADVSISLTIYRPDFYWIEQEHELQIEDASSDDKLVWASTYLIIPLEIALTMNKNNKEIESFELSIPDFYGWCHECGAPILHDSAEACSSCGQRLFKN